MLCSVECRMKAVAVCRLHKQIVDLREGFGILENMLVVAAHVAGKAELDGAASVTYLEIYHCAAEYVAGIEELEGDLTFDIELLVVRHTDEALHAGLSILFGIDGFDGFESLFLTFLVESLRIRLLNATGIGKHYGAQVACGRCTYHHAVESLLVNVWYQTGMVNMGMRKNQIVNLPGVEPEVAVHSVGLETLALVHSAVEQYFQSLFRRDKVLATCYLLRCS